MFLKYIYLFLIFLTFASCKENSKAFEYSGGTFKMCLNDSPSIYSPRNVTDLNSATVLYQVMEGLVSLNPDDLKVKPQIAKSWSISSDKKVFTFEIRNNIKFHNCSVFTSEEDRLLTIDDVIHSIKLACKKDADGNPTPGYITIFKGLIKGVDAFHDGKTNNIEGLKVDTNNQLKIELNQPDANFLQKLAHINTFITSKKVYEAKQEKLRIGTGPFVFTEINAKTVTLKKNYDYYLKDKKGNSLPYLDAVEFLIVPSKDKQLALFNEGETHFIKALPTNDISTLLESKMEEFNAIPPKLILRNNPILSTSYYIFNMTDKRFSDINVRKAINYAIDRSKLTAKILKGQAYEDGIFGIVPPFSKVFKKYDFSGVKETGYNFNPELAKKLFKEAGYPDGKNFGSIKLRINFGGFNELVAEEIAIQLKDVLNINVNIDASPFEIKDNDASLGKGELFCSTWYADFVSPESFFINFYGKIVPNSLDVPSTINQGRYINPKFDILLDQAKNANNISESMYLYSEAEKELLKNPPFIALWYNGDIQLLYSNVRNLYYNPLDFMSLREVYFKEWTKSEYESSLKN